MTISVLEAAENTRLGDLHAAADEVDEESLPCRVNDPELFFAELPADVEHAKTLCTDCPVQALCLAGALERREPWGVWGGQIFVDGKVVAEKRRRGRPPPHGLARAIGFVHDFRHADRRDPGRVRCRARQRRRDRRRDEAAS